MKKTLMYSTSVLLVLASATALVACQGKTPPTQKIPTASMLGEKAPAGYGTITGVVTTEGVRAVAPGGGNFRIFQASGTVGVVKVSSDVDTKEVTVAADGKFSVVVKGGADYTVEATVPDGKGGTMKSVATVTVPLATDPPIVDVKSLVTRRTGTIQGMIELKDAASGDTVEGADVFLSGGTSVIGKAGESGRFTLMAVAEGSWNVVVQKPGYKRAAVKADVKAGKPTMIKETILLEREDQTKVAGIKGLVRDSAGAAIAGATISAYPKVRAAGNVENFTAISNDQGEFEVLNLPVGEYQIQVYRPFYQLPARQTIKVEAGKTADLGAVKLTSTVVYFGKISGQVVDELGNPVDGAVVQTEPQVTDQQFADAKGNFTLDRVLPGQYNVSISAGGYRSVVMELRVENQQNFTLKLGRPIVMPADSPLSGADKTPKPPLVWIPAADAVLANSDIYAEAGDDPAGAKAPAATTGGALSPAGSASLDARPARVVVNLGGMVDPATMEALKLGKAEVTICEDDTVKAFKFTEATASGRSLPVDIGLIVDTTGSMGGTITGVKNSLVKFIEALYGKNIDAQVGAVSYSDGLRTASTVISPATDPAAWTVPGFEYLTPFVDGAGLKTPAEAERDLRANKVVSYISNLEARGGGGWPEGMLDSVWWAQNNGKGRSNSGLTKDNFGWRPNAQRVYIAMTDAPVWEKGGAEIMPSSPWSVPSLAAKLREEKAVMHVVSPNFPTMTGANSGDARGLAVALTKANTAGQPSAGTGGTWMPLPSGGAVDLTSLPVSRVIGNSVKLEFISYRAAINAADAKDHKIRVIVSKGGKTGESTFTLKY